MSITVETAKAHAKDPAISCCRFESGTTIQPSNLEDPAIFPDLIDSGLLTVPENTLCIEQVLGATLIKTIDALTPLTSEYFDGLVNTPTSTNSTPIEKNTSVPTMQTVSAPAMASCGSTIKLHIGEGKDIHLEIPLSFAQSTGMIAAPYSPEQMVAAPVAPKQQEEKLIRSLTRKHFKIDKVEFADKTKIDGTTLYLRKPELLSKEAIALQDLVVDMKIDIITPKQYNEYSETIMDIQPIATKESGELGCGITRVIDGVIIMVTGTDENGVQIGEFGSSEGVLETNIMWNRPGAPDKGEIFIKTQVTVKAGTNMERPGPLAAHHATDYITQEIREALKKADDSLVVKTEDINQYRRPSKKKIVVIKEIMGQGAMHDNLILPVEPVGTLGAKPNVDLGNIPIVMSPVEVLDGGIHALTCIGPASKENSRHYWRE
ncbi:MAG: D-proline reductase (dithiol) proprotein PrdA, partial [Oscillospiraceae bacterium]